MGSSMSSKAGGAKKREQHSGLVCKNRRAFHDYAIEERLEAGLQLVGTEVKSCRAGKANINEAYVMVRQGEAWLINAHIAEYAHGNRFNHDPTRARKLLLHKREIAGLQASLAQKGQVAVPLSLYFKHGYAKVEIGLGKGRKREDKRQVIKEREIKREMDRAIRRRRG